MAEALDNAAQQMLLSSFQSIERLEEQKKGISDAINDIWTNLKEAGIPVKEAKDVYKEFKMDPEAFRERSEIKDVIRHAVGLEG